jgi:GNAT superfamily N-acetyltransferase
VTIIAETADVTVREAVPDDAAQITEMIHELAHNEGEADTVHTSEDDVVRLLFPQSVGREANTPSGLPAAFCLVVDDPNHPGRLAGMAIWYLTVSTWEGRYGIHLEDLFVRSEARGLGVGKALVMTLAALCDDRGWARLEWAVHDSNEHARAFYRNLQAEEMEEWLTNRLSGRDLQRLADEVDL